MLSSLRFLILWKELYYWLEFSSKCWIEANLSGPDRLLPTDTTTRLPRQIPRPMETSVHYGRKDKLEIISKLMVCVFAVESHLMPITSSLVPNDPSHN